MEQSILTSTKKMLQIGDSDDSFDLDILTHINSALSTLHDLGVGPPAGLVVEDAVAVWNDFTEDTVQQGKIKTFVFLKVRMLFDPPATSFVISAFEKQIEEQLVRISMARENVEWVDPDPPEEEEV